MARAWQDADELEEVTETGTIYVHGPQSSLRTGLLAPWQNGIYRFSYMGEGQYCVPIGEHVNPRWVAQTLIRSQRYMPISGDYHVFCTDLQFGKPFNGRWGGNATYDGQRFSTFQVLSGKLTRPVEDITSHETAHHFDKTMLNDEDRRTIHDIIGIPNNGNDLGTPWEARSEEVIAEYLTLILGDQPLHQLMWQKWGYPTWETGERLRSWAERRFAGVPRAQVVVLPDMLEVSVTQGSRTALVNGQKEEIEATAITHGGFFSLPMASVTRWLKGSKSWDNATRTGTFKIPLE